MKIWTIMFLCVNVVSIVYFPMKYLIQRIAMKFQYAIVSFSSLNEHIALRDTTNTMEMNATTIYNNNHNTITSGKTNKNNIL